MQVPDSYEPRVFAQVLDELGRLMRQEAQRLSPSSQGQSLNVFATELHKLAVAMDGLSLRSPRTAPLVGRNPTDGNPG